MNPDTFNDDIHVVLFHKVVIPDTFNDDIHVVVFDNVVIPDTFNDDIIETFAVELVNIAPLKTAGNLHDPSIDVQRNLPVGLEK